MTIASNLYASRVFSEHPIVSWPLDDDATYISLISNEAYRGFNDATWTITSASSSVVDPDINNFPVGAFPDSIYTKLSLSSSSAQAISPILFNLQDLNQKMNTFAINFYIYVEDQVDSYQYGYGYVDPNTSTWTEDLKTVQTKVFGQWVRIGGTFNPPNVNADAKFILKINFKPVVGVDYFAIMNGLSMGQWSENTNANTLGVLPQEVNNEVQGLLGDGTMGVTLQAYAISEDDGYILVEDNRLLAINYGMPMVFGSDNVTRLYPSTLPSVVLPSKGVLNKSGQYNPYTVEMWLRIENNYSEARRIWGPIASDYGLYIKRGYISLVVGNSIGSHFVSEWYRPMLVHIVFQENNAFVLINGEKVINIYYETSSLTLPEINEDWMGFYCYDNMPIFELDCVSILPYVIPESVAKKRFVWGQGVEIPETINSAYDGTVAYIDYPYSEYTSNFIYPQTGNWQAGYFENLNVTNRSISAPTYSLPIISIGEKTIDQFYSDNKVKNDLQYPSASATVISASAIGNTVVYTTSASHQFEINDRITVSGASIKDFNTDSIIVSSSANAFALAVSASGSPTFTNGLAIRRHTKFTTFRPNENWTDPSYYLFERADILNETVNAIWGVFEIDNATTSSQPLMHFVNTVNGSSLKININGQTVTYVVSRINQADVTLFSASVVLNDHFVVGLNIPNAVSQWSSLLRDLFSNLSSVKVYIGGDGASTFEGIIYRVAFSNQSDVIEIQDRFYNIGTYGGLAIITGGETLNDHIASYTLIAMQEFNRFYLDIGVSSYWEEYYPLSFFAGYVKDKDGNSYYDLDFIQYNIGYPTTSVIVKSIETGSWTYKELLEAYLYPIAMTYEVLDNDLITGYDDYNDLKNKVKSTIEYDFSQSSLRSYVTFQSISNGANRSIKEYSLEQSIPESDILDVPEYSNQFSTKFEIKDQSIIYPPKSLGIQDTAIVVHLVIKLHGINTNPLNVRKMSLISKALSGNDFSQIGTRFGSKLYPYSKTGFYYDYKSKNPYSIYRDSTPYLHLTKNSGIEILGGRQFSVERGISIPINENKIIDQKVSSIQLFLKYNESTFPQVQVPIFSIDGNNTTIDFCVISDQSGSRGKIVAINHDTGADFTELAFYQNGIATINPYIEKDKWITLGIGFNNPIDMSTYTGAINLFSLCTFNNISYYKSTDLQESKSTVYRKWYDVLGVETTHNWQYWLDQDNPTWDNVLKLFEIGTYGVNPSDIFKAYTGTNREVVDDKSMLSITEDGITVFIGAEWSTYDKKPV